MDIEALILALTASALLALVALRLARRSPGARRQQRGRRHGDRAAAGASPECSETAPGIAF